MNLYDKIKITIKEELFSIDDVKHIDIRIQNKYKMTITNVCLKETEKLMRQIVFEYLDDIFDNVHIFMTDGSYFELDWSYDNEDFEFFNYVIPKVYNKTISLRDYVLSKTPEPKEII